MSMRLEMFLVLLAVVSAFVVGWMVGVQGMCAIAVRHGVAYEYHGFHWIDPAAK